MPFVLKYIARAATEYNALKSRAEQIEAGRDAPGRRKSSKDEGLFKQVNKALRLLRENPKHPSLSAHSYDSIPHPWDKKQKVWGAYAQNHTPGAYRIFWCYGPKKGEITIIAITPHP